MDESGPDLVGGDEPGSYDGVRFAERSLGGAVLRRAEFAECTFEHCAFGGASFLDCRFRDCVFKACDLSLAKVQGSAFVRATFEDSKLVGIDWTGVRPATFRLRLVGCNLSHASFAGMDLREIEILHCLARDVDFHDANLTSAKFHETDLTGSEFLHTNLTRADLSKASNYSIDPACNIIKKTVFSLPEAVSLLAGYDIVWR